MTIVRNKPNLRGAEIAANYRSERGLGEKCAENGREETKPIFPGRAGRRKKSGGTPNPLGRLYEEPRVCPSVQNKANFRHGADREIGVPGGRTCKTKPISVGAEAQLSHLQE